MKRRKRSQPQWLQKSKIEKEQTKTNGEQGEIQGPQPNKVQDILVGPEVTLEEPVTKENIIT